MRFLSLLCVVLALSAFSGCRKKTSPEFYKLEADQSILIARDGDDAYGSPELARIITALQALPDNVVEKERATALATKLSAEVARVAAARPVADAPKPPPTDPYAGRLQGVGSAPQAIEAPAEEVDAGPPTEPWTGMDEKTFASVFGKCFAKGPPAQWRNTPATTQVLNASADCQKAMGTTGGVTSYLFVDGGVVGKMVETTVVRDGGVSVEETVRPPAAPPDAGEPILTIPGAPLPEGFQKTTVY